MSDANPSVLRSTLGLRVQLGAGGTITPPTAGQSLVATNNQGDLEWRTIESGGGGDVFKVGTPVNDQVGVWTGDGTIEGTTSFIYRIENFNAMMGLGTTNSQAGRIRIYGGDGIFSNAQLIIHVNEGTTSGVTTWTLQSESVGAGNFSISSSSQNTFIIDAVTGVITSPAATISEISTASDAALITKGYLNDQLSSIEANGIDFSNIPTSSAGLAAGRCWNDSGTLRVV